ncbi:MAG: DUF1822 family protein [Spirulina sp. SIO3F2]|nr:DUF1822 family protein [Spirulina sp. SIO3F2]
MLKTNITMTTAPNTLALDIPKTAIVEAEGMLNTQSSAQAAWNAYHHHLAIETLIPWLQHHTQEVVRPWLLPSERAAFWDNVPGAALRWGNVHLMVLATESEGETDFAVPQEWVDVPEFMVDYYLAIELHMEPDESWLEVQGYTTHQTIKEQGQLLGSERCYVLPHDFLIKDFTLLLLAQRLFGSRRATVAPLADLSSEVQARLLQSCLNQPEPRFTLPFEHWGFLVAQSQWRSQLYQQRMVARREAQVNRQSTTALRQWFTALSTEIQTGAQALVNQSWQTLEAIAEEFQSSEAVLAYRFEGNYSRDITAPFPPAVSGVVELLASRTDKETQLSAIHLLGQIGRGNPDAITALAQFQRRTPDADLQRQAAVSLGKIDPSHPAAGVRRGKILDLGVRVGQAPLILMLTLLPEGDKTNLQVRLNGVNDRTLLPENLQLIIVDDEGTVFREARSRTHDQALQIAFRASSGDRFGIRVVLGEAHRTEFFMV